MISAKDFKDNNLVIPDYSKPDIVDFFKVMTNMNGADFEVNTKMEQIAKKIRPSKKMVAILVDAMGINILNEKDSKSSIIKDNLKMTLRTVNPSTTTTVLTSIATCRYPSEHGLIGFNLHDYEKNLDFIPLKFKELTSGIDLRELGYSFSDFINLKSVFSDYKNKSYFLQSEKYADSEYSHFFCGKGNEIIPYSDIKNAFTNLQEILLKDEESFVYLYIDSLDSLFHANGIDSRKGNVLFNTIDNEIRKIVSDDNISDVTICIFADHGHLSMHNEINIFELYKYFTNNHYIDLRTVTFSVKEELKDEFLEDFNKLYANDLLLFAKNDIETFNLFGPTPLSSEALNHLGDFVAVVKNNYSYIIPYASNKKYKGNHSGLSKEEIEIPLSVIKK